MAVTAMAAAPINRGLVKSRDSHDLPGCCVRLSSALAWSNRALAAFLAVSLGSNEYAFLVCMADSRSGARRSANWGYARRQDYPFENPMLNQFLVVTQKQGKPSYRWEKIKGPTFQ